MSIQQEQDLIKHKIEEVSTPSTPALGEDHLRNVAERVSQAGPQHRTDGEGFTAYDIEELEEDEGEAVEDEAPRLVTRGPHPSLDVTPLYFGANIDHQKTILDKVRVTAQETVDIMKQLVVLACPDAIFIPRKSGLNGYSRGYDIVLYAQDLGTIVYCCPHNEAQHKRPQLDINGNGKCQKINWHIFHHYLSLMERPEIKQVHIALDLFKGETSIEEVKQAHIDLKFKTPKSPRNPIIKPIGDIQPDGTNPGRTLYIGSTSSSKFIRFYEKAYERFKHHLNKEIDDSQSVIVKTLFRENASKVFEGYNDDKPIELKKWIRAELELKDGNCIIPLDSLIDPDKYFSGSYPYCQEIINMSDGVRPQRLLSSDVTDLEIRVRNVKPIASPTMSDLYYLGYTKEEVFDMLCDLKPPSQKLIRSGALKAEFKRI